MEEKSTQEYLDEVRRLFASVIAGEGNEQYCTLHPRPYSPEEVLAMIAFIGKFRPDELDIEAGLALTFRMWRD
mgnify:CR=1 FL=1